MEDLLKKRFDYISRLKTTSILLVVIYHCILFFADEPFFPELADQPLRVCTFLDYFISIMHNPALFMSSGFLFAHGLFTKDKSIPDMLWGRFKRLIVIYYIYGFLWLVPTYTLLNVSSYGRPENAGLLEGYKFMALGIFSDPLWFLWALFWTTFFYILISPVIKKRLYPVSLLLTVALYVLIKFPLADCPYFKISQLCPIITAFYLGILLYDADAFFNKIPVWVLFLITFITYANGVVYGYFAPTYPIWETISKTAGAFGSYCLFLAVYRLHLFEKIFNSKFWIYTDKHSFNIYLLHTTFLYMSFRFVYPRIGAYAFACIVMIAFETYMHTYAAVFVQDKIKELIAKIKKGSEKNG